MDRNSHRPPFPLLGVAGSALAGVFLFDSLAPSLPTGLSVSSATLVYGILRPSRHGFLLALSVLLGTLHIWRSQHSGSRLLASQIAPSEPRSVELYGTVRSFPESLMVQKGDQRSTFRLAVDAIKPWGTPQRKTEVLVHWKGPPPTFGDRVWARASLQLIPPARNPGEKDASAFFKRQNLWVEARLRRSLDGCVVEPAGGCWQVTALQVQNWISDQLGRGIEDKPQEHALISSMVLGVHGDGLSETRAWFRDTGTLHLFAVSGLNLSMLAFVLQTALRSVRVGPRVGAALTLVVLVLYAMVTGLGASCARALIMCAVWLGAEWMQRPGVPLNSLGLAAVVLLIADGNHLFQTDFQLSFGLVLALGLLTPSLRTPVHESFKPDPLIPARLWTPSQRRTLLISGRVTEALIVSFMSWVAGLPWGLLLFHQVTPVSVLANLVAVPVAFLNLTLGFMSVACAPLGPVTPGLNRLNALMAQGLLSFIKWSSTLPWAHFNEAVPFSHRPSLLVFDVGEGGAVWLRAGRSSWLFDCGSDFQSRRIIQPTLQLYGVNTLEGLILSHGDAAHIGGATQIQKAFKVARVVEPVLKDRSATRAAAQKEFERLGIPVERGSTGAVLLNRDSLRCEVLYPPPKTTASLADDKGLVLRWSTPDCTILYTADAGFPTERWLLENQRDLLKADVWIRGSHIREATGDDEFVGAISPRLVIVAGPPDGKHHETLRAWASHWNSRGISVWLQEDTGAVEGWIEENVHFRGYLSGDNLVWPAHDKHP